MIFLFIVDKTHNYVLMRAMHNDFPKIHRAMHTIMCDEMNDDIQKHMKYLFGSDIKYTYIDSRQVNYITFYRIKVNGTLHESGNIACHPDYRWHNVNDYNRCMRNEVINTIRNLKVKPIPVIGAGIMITHVKDGVEWVLLVHGRLSKKYGIPKGHCNPNEDITSTAIRETYEETGILVDASMLNVIVSTRKKKYRVFRISVDMDIYPSPAPMDRGEITHAVWMKKDDILANKISITNLTKSLIKR